MRGTWRILIVWMAAALLAGCETTTLDNRGTVSLAELQGVKEVVESPDDFVAEQRPPADETAPQEGDWPLGMDGPIRWLDADISGWAQTATLNARVSGSTMELKYDKARSWPIAKQRASDGGPLVGNCWILVKRDNVWYAATWDWMRHGQTSKPVGTVTGTGGHIQHAPLTTFRPVSGESYGFMVSTVVRARERTINERSNVSMVVWP